ncbi:MAG: hypothetical protein IKB07_05435 [Lachnospiraceae bacterium]|nr:hypothetical protein [Lachnospiraceae bacterium]
MNVTTAEKLVSSKTTYIFLDKDSVEDAKTKFLEFQKLNIIKPESTFDGSVWQTTDQYSNIGLHFEFDEKSYKKHYEALFEMSFRDFLAMVKTYLISLLGKNVLVTLAGVLLDIRHIINTAPRIVTSGDFTFDMPWLCMDFFTSFSLNMDDRFDDLMDALEGCMEKKIMRRHQNQRDLATFDTYFLFDELIKRYWQEDIPEEDRLFYYPLYLWWQITAVMPLRPREFILTERNCLSCKDGEYHLRLRRTHLKGGQSAIAYTLDGDYDIFTCRIPEKLANEIQTYINLTEKYAATDLDTLFVTDVHYKKWGMRKNRNSRYLSYTNMNTILRYFYEEIIRDRYGYSIVYEHDSSHLDDGEICYIHLGDTRHIALINIMQEGGTPVTAMLLAGHTNTEMASHYYSNITQMIECKTYRQHRRLISGDSKFSISNVSYVPSTKAFTTLSDNGKCYSEAYRNGEITDCLCSVGENGEIGYCPKCIHYRRDGISYFGSDDIYKRNIEADCKMLTEAIELVRKEKGSPEEIGEVLRRLYSSSKSYQAYLLNKLNEKEE